jgi:hypothetical protein
MARDENHRLAIVENSKCDRTYNQMYRTYCQFVDRQIDQGVLFKQGPSYFTGHFIDHFFSVVIAKNGSHLSPNYAKKFMYALDWFACRDPHTRGAVPVHGRPAVMEALQIQKWAHRAAAGKKGAAYAQQRLLLDMQVRFEQLEERERQWQQQNMQMSQMLQQYLTTFHPSGGASPRASVTNLVTPAAAAAAAVTIRDESPHPTEIIAATSPPPPPPPLQQ